MANFMKRVKAVHKEKSAKARAEMKKRVQAHQKKCHEEEQMREQKLRESKKRLHKILGDMKRHKEMKEAGKS